MLIEFSVTNFRSILERQTLSMAASAYFKELEELNTFASGLAENAPRLLRSTALYGPNASGKSTLIQALQFMQDRVENSQKESQAGDEIETTPFKLSARSREADSTFEIVFVETNVRYEYGFSCNRQRFTEEWLFAYPNGRPQKWFHRVYDAAADKDVYKFSTSFLGDRKRQDWKAQARQNALFLSVAIQLNNKQLKPVFSWFHQRLQIIAAPQRLSVAYTLNKFKNEAIKKKIIGFMNTSDLAIADIEVKTAPFSLEMISKETPIDVRGELAKRFENHDLSTVKFMHADIETQALIAMDQSEESDGTRALFAFAGPWLDVIEHDRVLVVDELDSSLHPLVVQHLVKRLHHAGTKAQLVFTTHDATLLSQSLFRRDQIWFTEKDKNSSTRLYPLSDFSPRENEAIERGYLNGRYGAIPFLKDLDFYGVG